jgi:hypothetical protein
MEGSGVSFEPNLKARPDEDPVVIEAISEGRHAEDIYLVDCPWCGFVSYYNQGSHASCRNCERDLTPQIADTFTLADYWDDTPYPCDFSNPANAEPKSSEPTPEAKE